MVRSSVWGTRHSSKNSRYSWSTCEHTGLRLESSKTKALTMPANRPGPCLDGAGIPSLKGVRDWQGQTKREAQTTSEEEKRRVS